MLTKPTIETRPNPIPCTQAELSDMPPDINAANYPPVRICEIDLAEALPMLSAVNEQTGQRYQRVWCLIRLHSQPIGIVELDFEDSALSPKQYVQHIWAVLQTQIKE